MKLYRKIYNEKEKNSDLGKDMATGLIAVGSIPIINAAGSELGDLASESFRKAVGKEANLERSHKEKFGTHSDLYKKIKRTINTRPDIDLVEDRGIRVSNSGGYRDKDLYNRSKSGKFKPSGEPFAKKSKHTVRHSYDFPSVLAHEYGHYKNHQVKGLRGDDIGRRVTKKISNNTFITKALPSTAGLASGFAAGKREAEGKDAGILNHGGLITGLAVSAPRLAEEGAASVRAHKMLKKAGANKQQLKAGRKSLAGAYGTYLVTPVVSSARGVALNKIGKVAGKHYYKNNKDETE